MTEKLLPKDARDWTTYWFVRLELAVEEADYALAAEAQENLNRLGVDVRFHRIVKPAAGLQNLEVANAR